MYRDGEPSGTATKELGLLVIHLASDRTESHNFAYELGIQVSIGIWYWKSSLASVIRKSAEAVAQKVTAACHKDVYKYEYVEFRTLDNH